MKKILVIGIKGMAGHLIFERLRKSEKFKVWGIARNIEENLSVFNIDVSDTNRLKYLLSEYEFDAIINCVGILNKDAEDNPSKAIWFNSYFPHFLEEITKDTLTQVIHISTDCVFDGKRGGYTELDIKDGVGFYAQSKALGELVNTKDLTIRTSIIGPEINRNGIGLFHWFMTQPKDAKLNGFTQAFWSGITTLELSKVIEFVLENKFTGLIQLAPKQKIDKYNLLKLFNKIFRENKLTIIPNDHYKVDKSLISVRKDFTYQVSDYEKMLYDMKEWMEKEYKYSYE